MATSTYEQSQLHQPAMAHAAACTPPFDSDQGLAALVAPYKGKSQGHRFQGPAWVNDQGLACLVVLAPDQKTVDRIRAENSCAFIAWRWNGTPSVHFSLTLVTKAGNPRPHTRWIAGSGDPVVLAIRRERRFLVAVVSPTGRNSGWLEASFDRGSDRAGVERRALEALWDFDTPGIPYSHIHVRFDPVRTTAFNDTATDQIPLWADPQSDYWATLEHEGPWKADLSARDKAQAAWGGSAHARRWRAAGFVQQLIERQVHDSVAPLVDETGQWKRDDEFRERALVMVARAPTLGTWLAAMVGPDPNAHAAYEAAFATLNTPYDLFCLLDKMFELLQQLDDWVLNEAVQANLEAALLDSRITRCGTQRPWIANTAAGYGLELRSSQFDLDAPLEDIKRMWGLGTSIMGLFDTGLRIGYSDFPAPLDVICDAFQSLTLEGSVDNAQLKVQSLLREAQEARQWSIPWGARVQIQFGPFTSIRIFEKDGEFSCHFLDEHDRYFLVAIGLQAQPPKASSSHLIRYLSDGDDVVWNTDAETSLMLIAAAIVRDFIVVEERQSLFTARPMRRRIRGRDVRTVIYLPRVRYSATRPEKLSAGDTSNGRSKHQVAPHIRRAGTSSTAQRFLAQRYGMHLPEGFTFVRPHVRGGEQDEQRIRVYRSRSASKMIFEEVSTAPEGTRPAWFDFERDCARLLTARGMKVIHQAAQRCGDGGIDLFAVDAAGDSWVVQCKCWSANRPVGPDVVRELAGAITAADCGKSTASHGMIITTSRLTRGALEVAAALGFEIVQGDALANGLA